MDGSSSTAVVLQGFSPSPSSPASSGLDPEDAAALANLFEVVGQNQAVTATGLPKNVALKRVAVTEIGEEDIEDAFGNLFSVMTQATQDTEIKKTSLVVQEFFKGVEAVLEKLNAQNASLEVAAIHAENALQLLDIAHEGNVLALKKEIERTHSERQALEQSAVQAVEQTRAQVAAIEKAQAKAVKVIHETTQMRLLAEKTAYQSMIDTFEQAVDTLHTTLDRTLMECEQPSLDYPSIEAAINAPNVLENHNSVIDSISIAGKAHGRILESLAVKNLLKEPTQQLKEYIKKRATADSETSIHV